MKPVRLERINAEIKRVVSEILRDADYIDPACMGSVVRVDTSGDLSFSDIYFSIFCTDTDRRKAQFNALASNQKHIRQRLAARMSGLRIIPDLRFHLDTSMEYSEKINALISKLDERKK
ncbi:MAG: 30S ribosome-binding factor RbfA [Firmicutes bacterium]|nr:30S ribosome-binding factor RbfA [Bacillota bacterium]